MAGSWEWKPNWDEEGPYWIQVWNGEGDPSEADKPKNVWEDNFNGIGLINNNYEKTVGPDGKEIWTNERVAAPGYQGRNSSDNPIDNPPWQIAAMDTGLSILEPVWALFSGGTKALVHGSRGNWGRAAGGVVQGVSGAYGAFGGGAGAAGADAGSNIDYGELGTGPGVGTGIEGGTNIDYNELGNDPTGEAWQTERSGKPFIQKAAESYAKNYAKSALLKVLSGGEESGGQPQQPRGFMIEDSPLADVFKDKEKSLDKVFEMTGETGDIGTAVAAAKAFEMTLSQGAELEREIAKFSGDPDYKVIEPELRATTLEAIQQGMSPREATAYAFEKAKKERAFSDFLREFQMKKKLELAGMSGEEQGVSL